jgi:hypothetical protein
MDRNQPPNKPLDTLRDGRLKATIWENDGQNGPYHTVTLAKVYEDQQGKLQETSSFSGGELLRIAELARESHAYVRDLRRERTLDRQTERPSERTAERPAARDEQVRDEKPQRFRDYPSPAR